MPTDQEFIEGNRTVIEEFRSNAGIVAALGYPILLLTTTGARTGRRGNDTAWLWSGLWTGVRSGI